MLGNSWVGEGGVYTGQLGVKPENWKRFQPHLQVSWEKGRVGLGGGFCSNFLYQICSMRLESGLPGLVIYRGSVSSLCLSSLQWEHGGQPLWEVVSSPSLGIIYWMLVRALQCRRPGFDPWAGKIPWRRKWQPVPVFLPGKSHGQRSLAGYSPWDHKESDLTEQLTLTFSYQLWVLGMAMLL